MQSVVPIYQLYERWYEGDLDGIIAAVDESIEVDERDVLPYHGSYLGRSAYLGLLSRIIGEFSLLEIAPRDFIAGEDHVLVQGRYFGVHAEGLVDAEFIHLWRLHEGRPVALGAYESTFDAWKEIDRHDLTFGP